MQKQPLPSMDGMSPEPAQMSPEPVQAPVLPFVCAQPLVDHHCHGVLRAGGDLAGLLNEADGDAVADGMAFDSLAGLAFRRWCPPLLGLPSHASPGSYAERRGALGAAGGGRGVPRRGGGGRRLRGGGGARPAGGAPGAPPPRPPPPPRAPPPRRGGVL